MAENIEKLKELLADGYKIIQKQSWLMADPNATSPIKLTLVKNDDKIEITFTDKDAGMANLIYETQN
jgi:hypothetical protein